MDGRLRALLKEALAGVRNLFVADAGGVIRHAIAPNWSARRFRPAPISNLPATSRPEERSCFSAPTRRAPATGR